MDMAQLHSLSGNSRVEFRTYSIKSRLFINNTNLIKAVSYLQLLRIPGMINEIISILKNGKRN